MRPSKRQSETRRYVTSRGQAWPNRGTTCAPCPIGTSIAPRSPASRVAGTLSAFVKRHRTPRDVAAWLHFTGTYGPVVDGRYVTLSELTPSFLLDHMQRAGSFGYPGASKLQLRAVGRKQMA